MNILLTGATGFIGRHIASALGQAGHEVIRARSGRHAGAEQGAITVDFARDTSPLIWAERLAGVDVVINAVGILRDSRARPMVAVHRETPMALFDACVKAGVRRIIQISALGIEASQTVYARSKRAADAHLLALAEQGLISAVVLRPSVVFGRGGASSGLFMRLARWPLVGLPGPVISARVQPVAVTDLAAAVAALAGSDQPRSAVLPCTGPHVVRLGDLIASLRQQLGRAPARVLRLPDLLTRLSAHAGDVLPVSPWCSETLALLGQDNVGDAGVVRGLLGRDGVHYQHLVDQVWRAA